MHNSPVENATVIERCKGKQIDYIIYDVSVEHKEQTDATGDIQFPNSLFHTGILLCINVIIPIYIYNFQYFCKKYTWQGENLGV